jgi:hypothetical protein
MNAMKYCADANAGEHCARNRHPCVHDVIVPLLWKAWSTDGEPSDD